MAGIIWLASYPKSGNTWLRAFLANYMADPARALPINELPNYTLGDNMQLHYEQFTGRTFTELDAGDIARLRPRIHQWFMQSRREEVFVKTHNAVIHVDKVPLITPSATAGAIYVIRNPFDVAVSFAHHYQVDYDVAVESLCAEDYRLPATTVTLPQYLSSWSRHARSWLEAPGLTRHLMRYEDMSRNPQKAFNKLTKFLGLPSEPARVKKAIRFSSFRELAAQEAKTPFVEARPDGKSKFFRAGQAGSWRKVLSETQVARLTDAHGPMMREVGYLTASGDIRA